MSVSSSSTNLIANGGGGGCEGERGGAQGQGDGGGKTFPPRFVSDAAKNTFKYVKKVQLEADEIGDENRWTPFAFQLIPPEDNHRNVEKSELFKKIRMAGGTIHPGADVEAYVPGVIRILNEDYYVEHENEDIRVPLDTYSSAFVYRCILNKNRGLPLPHPWKYLIPSDASNFGFYDARKILREEMEWEDVGKLVFPPKDKRITAQQWLAELRRQLAKLEMTTAAPPSEDSLPSQNLNLSNGTATTPTATATVLEPEGSNLPSRSRPKSNDSVGSSHNQRNIQRKRSREPEKDDNTKETENDRQKTIPLKKKDADQPISRSASALIATTTTSSNGIQVPPAATPSTSKAPSPVKIHVKAVKLASSISPPKNPSEPSSSTPPRRIEFVRATPPKPNQSSSTTTSPPTTTTSRIGPPSPKKSKTDSMAAKNDQHGNNLSSKEKSSENVTLSLPSSSKSHSSSAKLNGSVPASASSSSTSSSTSENGRESSSPPKARLGKVVAVAGPKSRRYGPKPVPPPARDDGWVNCDDKNESSDDESVHFSDNNGNGSDSEVDVKPKLKPFWARMYSVEEGQRLLDLICHHNAYAYVHGLKFWKLVERSRKFKDRTHQSLKNHFHKVVCQKLTSNRSRDSSTYKIDPENMKKLKRGLQNRINKHHNMCPDFEI
ncbi:unnamed protein product [Orchesella dallaii]|uniref:Myb-like domain-containing protein n=1 Tax=Orchesella dallaii TaxID=48710 RepID=A0ABP1RQD1_9HEXA